MQSPFHGDASCSPRFGVDQGNGPVIRFNRRFHLCDARRPLAANRRVGSCDCHRPVRPSGRSGLGHRVQRAFRRQDAAARSADGSASTIAKCRSVASTPDRDVIRGEVHPLWRAGRRRGLFRRASSSGQARWRPCGWPRARCPCDAGRHSRSGDCLVLSTIERTDKGDGSPSRPQDRTVKKGLDSAGAIGSVPSRRQAFCSSC